MSVHLRAYRPSSPSAFQRIAAPAPRYERNYNKFLDIFRLDRRIPSYFVPGNNDVGCVLCFLS